ncbi:Uncharacterised protein [Mycobacteroides abscessus subsp. abscessus]|nr:Uncharacterised protein [Mycobacteroides abscessus subsp. abscessus]
MIETGVRHAAAQTQAAQSRQVGDPDQEQRTFFDVFLITGQMRQPLLARGVGHGNHAPGLQVR